MNPFPAFSIRDSIQVCIYYLFNNLLPITAVLL
jgi:hypothetical protein